VNLRRRRKVIIYKKRQRSGDYFTEEKCNEERISFYFGKKSSIIQSTVNLLTSYTAH
jgi:transcription elongation factor Elf1